MKVKGQAFVYFCMGFSWDCVGLIRSPYLVNVIPSVGLKRSPYLVNFIYSSVGLMISPYLVKFHIQ